MVHYCQDWSPDYRNVLTWKTKKELPELNNKEFKINWDKDKV